MNRSKKTLRNSSILGTLGVFVFTAVFGLTVLVAPHPAQAQGMTVLDPATVSLLGLQVKDTTQETITMALVNTAAIALLNAANYFAQKIAFDAANYVASGGKGQKPFFTTEGLGDYLGNVGKDAAGEALGTISQVSGLEKLGINLCSPTSPKIALNIKLGFLNGLPGLLGGPPSRNAPQPKCNWRTIADNWDEFSNLDSETVLSQAGVMFTPGQSSLSSALEFNRHSLQLIDRKKQEAIDDFVAKTGFKDLVSKVSGKVLTPADTIKAEMEASNAKARAAGEDTMIGMTPTAFGKGAFGILPAALQTFAGTLGEKLMKKAFERGLISLQDIFGNNDGEDDPFKFDTPGSGGGRAAAELANADLLTPRIFSSTNYDELTIFATCPSEGAQPDHCVIDTDLFNGIQRSKQGEPMTVQQALDQAFLHGERRMLPLGHQDNASLHCYQNSYCYSNLIKMRRARIIPIGWELAANSQFNDVGKPVTLKEVVDNFNNCPVDSDGKVNLNALPDPLHPWCRLIDPDWILKYPEAICTQQAAGPTLLNPIGDVRGSSCVDSQSCILEDDNGKCIGGFGYCLAEKSFWKFGGDSCPAHFASCETVRRTDDGSQFSYLMNTTEVDVCNQNNAGCRQYSQSGNLVSNGGFEDVFSGALRDWNVGNFTGAARDSQNGTNALDLSAGESDFQIIPSVLSGSVYEISASALAQNSSSSGALVSIEIKFNDIDGGVVTEKSGELKTDCQLSVDGLSATTEITTSDFGYFSTKCSVAAPVDAVSALISVEVDGGDVFIDDLALFGNSFSFNPSDTVHLNGNAEECPVEQLGCKEFISADSASLNLVKNPGFEIKNNTETRPVSWRLTSDASYQFDSLSDSGNFSVVALSNNPISQEVRGLLDEAVYVFGVSSRLINEGDAPIANATLTILNAAGEARLPTSLSDGCEEAGTSFIVPLPIATDYRRAECQFTTPPDTKTILVSLATNSFTNDVFADLIQLELGEKSTSFHDGYLETAKKIHLKAPPSGLNCNGSATDPAACEGLALSCRREEVGCNLYTPSGEGVSIPAITKSGDLCPVECSGYETFRQEPTDFSDEQFPLFLIPDTAISCSASEAGCEEFTNLDLASSGGEAREYFTSLRLCTNPDADTETFYTWEGSDTEGFQLKVWSLKKSNLKSTATGESGEDPTGGVAPCTNLTYSPLGAPQCADSVADENIHSCNKITSNFNGDCREFYDVDGNIHYRFFSKTIVATEQCSEYRMTRTNDDECRTHGGLWNGSECHYFAIGSESSSCSVEASGCRAYTGNASRNIRLVLSSSFESGTTDGWEASPGVGSPSLVSNSNESVSAGGHSLKITNSQTVKDVSSDINAGKTYLLDFWAKGSGELRINFTSAGDEAFTFNRVTNDESLVAVTTSWRSFTIGPVNVINSPLTGETAVDREHLIFEYLPVGNASLFLDNIVLKEVEEAEYVVANSWNTPASCDQTPNGNIAPQFMLGCQTYSDMTNTKTHLKSFSRLCREEAVGCSALYDTHNTPTPFTQAFNAVCTLPNSGDNIDPITGACVPSFGVTCACEVNDSTVCQVSLGDTFCKFNTNESIDKRLATEGGNISTAGDTILIPDDSLVYLIDSPDYRCKEEFRGCSALGLPSFNNEGDTVTDWETVSLFNLPEDYENTLCRSEENFCQAYTTTLDGSSAFFKDPLNHTCEYKPSVTINGFKFSGFFKKGTDQPCDADFLKNGTSYGIWKNSDADYDGWVGLCPSNFDQCKEFIDPQDSSQAHPAGQPYYAILNDELDVKTCQNEVSLSSSPKLAEGASACVLFDQTDLLTKRFDSGASYDVSADNNGELSAVVSSEVNDTNIVIRVNRDRRCGEWLDCRSSEKVFNSATGAFQNVCTDYAICNQFTESGDSTQCTQYTDSLYTGDILTPELYQTRPIGQDGFELTGFSIPNKYPINELITIDISERADPPEFRLVHSIGAHEDCAGNYGSVCGPENVLGNQGRCLGNGGGECVYSIDGAEGYSGTGNLNVSTWNFRYPSSSCRAFPQTNSPYPAKVADPGGWDVSVSKFNNDNPVLISPGPAFKGANVCQRRFDDNGVEYESCECSYQIGSYGRSSQPKYFSLFDNDLPTGYCEGGAFEAYECDPRAGGERTTNNLSCCSPKSGTFDFGEGGGCSDGATCLPLSKVERVVGYEGQCLEQDLRNPINGAFNEFACSTWRPVGVIGGSLDIYNLNQSAGFFVKPDRKFYCAGERDIVIKEFMITGKDAKRTDGDTDSLKESDDLNGDGYINPYDLDITNFFGLGKVSKAIRTPGSKVDCSDESSDGAWCIYPGLSSSIESKKDDDKNTIEGGFFIDSEALGILGCYEVAAGGSPSSTYIDYPYIGAPIYADQLLNIYFQVTDDIYYLEGGDERDRIANIYGDELRALNQSRGLPINNITSNIPNRSFRLDLDDDFVQKDGEKLDKLMTAVTNPYQDVHKDCNNDGNDNIDSEVNDDHDNDPVSESERILGNDSAVAKNLSYYFLTEDNDFEVDASDKQGSIILQARFDSFNRLEFIRVAASDNKDEGAFGINRMGFVFKEGCSSVVQVDIDGEYGLTKAYTDRVNSFADYTKTPVSKISPAAFETSCQPWGAIGNISAAPPSAPWTLVTTYADNENQCTGDSFIKAGRFGSKTAFGLTNSIRNLFRKIENAWTYQGISSGASPNLEPRLQAELYRVIGSAEGTAYYDDTSVATGSPGARDTANGSVLSSYHLPVIASVSSTKCDGNGNCAVDALGSVNINGRTDGILSAQNGILKAYAKFYGWAAHDAMPILARKVFWGDKTQPEAASKGWYKNQKPFCSPSVGINDGVGECTNFHGTTCVTDRDCPGSIVGSCDNNEGNHFGNTPGACRDIPFEFEHVYTCTVDDLNDLDACIDENTTDGYASNAPCVRDVDPDGDGITESSPACVYRPAVQIKDNWDWCNCTGSGCENINGLKGAYGPDCEGVSVDGSIKPWTEFDGELRVFPNPDDVN